MLAGCRRTIYVCDDGKDRKKRRLCQRLGRDCIYVSGRTRTPNEMNGKSGNLNNCCRQIYPEGCTIPANEVICIMDADQVSLATAVNMGQWAVHVLRDLIVHREPFVCTLVLVRPAATFSRM